MNAKKIKNVYCNQKKNQRLREDSPKRARMFSSFGYRKILGAIKAKAYKEGVEVLQRERDPAIQQQIEEVIGRAAILSRPAFRLLQNFVNTFNS